MLVLVTGGVPAGTHAFLPRGGSLLDGLRGGSSSGRRIVDCSFGGGGARDRGGQNFLEQLGLLQIFLGRGRLLVAVVMIVIAGAAADFGGLGIN